MKRTGLILLTLCLCIAMLAGCGAGTDKSGAEDKSLTKVMGDGKMIVGLDDSFPPMGFRDDAGQLVGFDIDMAKEVGRRMGIEMVLQPIDWKAKETELKLKTVDCLWNGYTITPARKEQVNFTDPYMKNNQVIVVLKDSKINAIADLKGKKVAVQDGSSAQEALAAQDIYSQIKQQIDFADNVTAFMDIDNKQADALAIDLVVADYYLTLKPNKYRILSETLAPEEYGVGFRKEDVALHDKIQETINAMIADGTAKTISMKWFGRDVTAK